MIRRKGIAGFVGNSLHRIKGIFKPSYSLTSITIAPSDIVDGIVSLITSDGFGITGAITASGDGITSTIESGGIISSMTSDGFGVTSDIVTSGNGITSTM